MFQVLKELKVQFLLDFRSNFGILVFEFLAVAFSIGSSCSLAIFGKNSNLHLIFTSYLLSSIFLVIASKKRNNSFYLILGIVYIIVNGIGLYRLDW